MLLVDVAHAGGYAAGTCRRRDRALRFQQLVSALRARRAAIGARRIASKLPCVMPIREDGTHGDKEQKGCADRNDQVDPKIPAVAFFRHGRSVK